MTKNKKPNVTWVTSLFARSAYNFSQRNSFFGNFLIPQMVSKIHESHFSCLEKRFIKKALITWKEKLNDNH